MVSRYVNGPVKPEGICLLPPPPQHYRMMAPRGDTYHVSTQPTFVASQPPNQSGNQGPAMRVMPQTGPPNQASTPPNTELKVQQLPQPSVNIAYVQNPVRGNQTYYTRAPPQPNPTQRMSNHRQTQQQQQLYSPHQGPGPYVLPQSMPPMFMNTATIPYFNSTQRNYLPPLQMGQSFSYPYPTQSQAQQYYYSTVAMPRAAPPVVQQQPQNLNQQTQSIQMAQTSQPHIPSTKKRRANAIPIIDPNTGKDKLTEVLNDQDDSHPPSGESSARQTPQPHLMKEVQATFAKQVAQAKNEDNLEDMIDHAEHHIESHIFHNPQLAQNLTQTSKLQAQSKEFYPSHQSIAKETTPVVSANTDAVEITISSNKGKDRESPIKSKKREPHKEMPKEESKQPVVKDEPKPQMPLKENVPAAPALVEVKEVPVSAVLEDKKGNKREKTDSKSRSSFTEPEVSAPSSPVLPNTNAQDIAKNKNSNQRKDSVGKPAPQPQQPQSQPQQVLSALPSAAAQKQQQQAQQQSQQQPQQPPQQQPQQQSPQQLQQPGVAAPPVPQSQPTKPSSKSSKMRDLNLKGASKEGTDMDAFQDNSNLANENADANANANVPQNVNVNANENSTNNNVIADISKTNEAGTVKQPEVKQAKGKCVTDIVKEVPKPITNFYPLQDNGQDGKPIVFGADKKVLAKNEANAKNSADNNNAQAQTDIKPSLPYKEGQWSPLNPSGKKVYDIEFLYALRAVEKSNIKPTNIPTDVIAQDDRNRLDNINRFPTGGRANDFAPNFGNVYAGKSSSRGAPVKRNSQSKIGGGSKGSKSNIIRVSISVKEDVKLHESENAWRPARYNLSAEETEDDRKTKALYKTVRGILNKLTPQKFDTLLNQVRTLQIDTTERLQGVIDLVFEKAIDEPNFSVAYASLCRELALMQVPANTEKNSVTDYVNFRKLMVTRCQMEFEKNSKDEKDRNDKVIEIENCTDAERKKELQINLEEDDRRIRMKSVGYIRFIGELFKQQMLTASIMFRCLHKLLENKDEESLECLCKLLTTVGKELETKKNDLGEMFKRMTEIADKRHCKVSSRIRFMLQDVIDLKNANWQPRRQDLNPTTMDQIQKEANDEQFAIQAMNSVPITPRKDDRGSSGMNSDRKRGGRNVNNNNEDGWSTAGRNRSVQFQVQSDKLKNKPPLVDEPLGNRQMFDNWGRGSNIKTANMNPATSSPNMYAALENIGNDTDKRSSDLRGGGRSSTREPYSSKGPSLEKSYKQPHDRRNSSRSGSQHRSAESSQRSTPVPTAPKQIAAPMSAPVPAPAVELTPEKYDMKWNTIFEEYLNDCSTAAEIDDELKYFPQSELERIVANGCLSMLERTKTARLKSGELFAKLIKLERLPLESYLLGLEEVLSQADDLIIDIPKLWDYLPEIISPILAYEVIPLKVLVERPFNALKAQNHMAKLLGPLFKLLVTDKGPIFLQNLWNQSGLQMTDVISAESLNDFIDKNGLGFLLGAPVTQQSTLSYEQIHAKLLQFFQNNAPFDDIKEWISANVGDRTTDKDFIRVMFDAILQNSIQQNKLKEDVLANHQKMLLSYVQHNPEYELQCLFALQLHINQLQHPQGLLLKICNKLYDDGSFSQEGFLAWEADDNPAEQTGKGVAVKQLNSFFTHLKEADEDSVSSASEET